MEAALRCALARAGGGWGIREWAPGGSSRGDRPDPHPRTPPGYAPARPKRRSLPLPRTPASPSSRPPHAPPPAARDQPPTAPSPGPEEDAGGGAAGPRPVPARTAPPPRRNKAPRGRAGEPASSTHRGRAGRDAGPGSPSGRVGAERPLQSASRGAGAAAVLGGQGSDAAAAPFSRPGPCSAASSPSPGPRRRLSLGAARAAPLHQGRAGPRGTSRKVRAGGRLPQLLVAIFNPPPPPALPTSRAG